MDVPPTPRQSAAVTPSSTTPARGAPPPNAVTPKGGAPVGRPFAGILAATLGRRGIGIGLLASRAPVVPGKTAQPSPAGAPQGQEAVDPEKGSRGGGREGEGDGDGGRRDDARDLELLDPAARHAASLAPPALSMATPVSPAEASEAPLRARSLEELLPALVRRIAWAGDKHRGTVRLELGAGAYAGTTVVVHADAGRVRVEITGSEGPELDRLRARLDGRLRSHGLDVESVT
jgi:hypothetical protein